MSTYIAVTCPFSLPRFIFKYENEHNLSKTVIMLNITDAERSWTVRIPEEIANNVGVWKDMLATARDEVDGPVIEYQVHSVLNN